MNDGGDIFVLIVCALVIGAISGYQAGTASDHTPAHVEWSELMCETNGGLRSFDDDGATCENGAKFHRSRGHD